MLNTPRAGPVKININSILTLKELTTWDQESQFDSSSGSHGSSPMDHKDSVLRDWKKAIGRRWPVNGAQNLK